MKRLTLLLFSVLSLNIVAQEQPAYLKDATITVKLKNGKTYEYSANEYAVIKRNAVKKIDLAQVEVQEEIQTTQSKSVEVVEAKQNRNIISLELIRSQNGISRLTTPSQEEVETVNKTGAGIMYQNNVYKDLYLGGRIDTNGGGGVNIGVGF